MIALLDGVRHVSHTEWGPIDNAACGINILRAALEDEAGNPPSCLACIACHGGWPTAIIINSVTHAVYLQHKRTSFMTICQLRVPTGSHLLWRDVDCMGCVAGRVTP